MLHYIEKIRELYPEGNQLNAGYFNPKGMYRKVYTPYLVSIFKRLQKE